MTKYIVSWEVDDVWGDALGNKKDYYICDSLRFARVTAKKVQLMVPSVSKLTISKYGQIMLSRYENDAIR